MVNLETTVLNKISVATYSERTIHKSLKLKKDLIMFDDNRMDNLCKSFRFEIDKKLLFDDDNLILVKNLITAKNKF